uniref:hypothetical protein n=1 Tax=Acetivibrio cellulolyticus TaxID=35830 RepID=UPI0001E2E6BE|nr:hypothetical protein [Acetivibrio cellulolyticus]
MYYAINKLQELRDCAIKELKQGKNEFLKTKLELDRAISCLEFCMEHDLFSDNKEKYSVLELPLPEGTGYFSDYRIVDDCETEDKEFWRELKFEGKKVFLSSGDIIIKRE